VFIVSRLIKEFPKGIFFFMYYATSRAQSYRALDLQRKHSCACMAALCIAHMQRTKFVRSHLERLISSGTGWSSISQIKAWYVLFFLPPSDFRCDRSSHTSRSPHRLTCCHESLDNLDDDPRGGANFCHLVMFPRTPALLSGRQ